MTWRFPPTLEWGLSYLQDAPCLRYRQDDYLVPFQRFAVAPSPVNVSVQNLYQIKSGETKLLLYNHLQFLIFTVLRAPAAPKLCVDFIHYSGNFAYVDGRKGWHNKTSQSEVD